MLSESETIKRDNSFKIAKHELLGDQVMIDN